MQHPTRILCLLYGLAAVLFGLSVPVLAQGPGEVVLYQADFDDGQAQGWELEPGWTVAEGTLRGEGHRWVRSMAGPWQDFRVQFRLKLLQGRIHLVYRLNQTGRYFVGFHEV